MATPNDSNRTRWLKLIVICAVGLATGISLPLLYFAATRSSVFAVQEIRFEGIKNVSSEELSEYTNDLIGKPLYGIDLSAVTSEVDEHPWVRTSNVRRAPPHTLIVAVQERHPLGILHLNDPYVIDEDGLPFLPARLVKATDLPLVTGVSKKDFDTHKTKSKERLLIAASAIHFYVENKQPCGPLLEVSSHPAKGIVAFCKSGVEIELGAKNFDKKWKKFGQILDLLGDKKKDLAYVNMGGDNVTSRVAVRFEKMANNNTLINTQ